VLEGTRGDDPAVLLSTPFSRIDSRMESFFMFWPWSQLGRRVGYIIHHFGGLDLLLHFINKFLIFISLNFIIFANLVDCLFYDGNVFKKGLDALTQEFVAYF